MNGSLPSVKILYGSMKTATAAADRSTAGISVYQKLWLIGIPVVSIVLLKNMILMSRLYAIAWKTILVCGHAWDCRWTE